MTKFRKWFPGKGNSIFSFKETIWNRGKKNNDTLKHVLRITFFTNCDGTGVADEEIVVVGVDVDDHVPAGAGPTGDADASTRFDAAAAHLHDPTPVPSNITDFYRVLPVFTGFYRFLPVFTGFYRFLLVFTGFHSWCNHIVQDILSEMESS